MRHYGDTSLWVNSNLTFNEHSIMRKTIIDSILAGICISLGGVAFLKVGGIVGAVLFSFGLITVVCYKMKLYTGVSGFVENKRDWIELPVIIAEIGRAHV